MPDETIKAESDFVNSFAAKLDAADVPETAAPSKPATPAPTPAAADEEPDTKLVVDDTPDDTPDDDAAAKGDEEPAKAAEKDTPADKPEKKGEEKKDDDPPEATEEEKEEAAQDKAIADEVQASLEKHGLKVKLDDLPAEARPLVQKKLDHMQAVVTRALQEHRAYRKDEQEFRAEQRFREEHPELAVAEILAAKPELIEKVQEWLDKTADPDKAKLFKIEVDDARKLGRDAIAADVAAKDHANQRADEIKTYTRRACANLNVPYDTVIKAVKLALLGKDTADGDLSQDELDAVIADEARIIKRHSAARVREDRKADIRARTKDRRESTPAVRVGSGAAAPAPSRKPAPKNDAEFTEQFLSKI